MLLQNGIPHQKIYDTFKFSQFLPHGMSSLRLVPFCKSIPDLICKYMEKKFPPTASTEETSEYDSIVEAVVNQGG